MRLETGAVHKGPGAFAAQVKQRSGQDPAQCYQCGKCTAGCPVAFAMDLDPARVMRLVQLGQRDKVLSSHTIWLCASCETCTTRCPQEVDTAAVMDALRILAREAGFTQAEKDVAGFNQTFLDGVRRSGRVHEMALAMIHTVKTMHPFRDMGKGMRMATHGKVSLKGHLAANRDQVRRIFENAARIEGEQK